MYRPTIKSDLWLGIMTVIFLGLYWWSENSLVTVRVPNYQQRIEAANTMVQAMDALEQHRLPALEQPVSNREDPLIFTLLGEKDSPITTNEGRIDEKITVLNPNFAAVMVDLLTEAGLKPGDRVAVMLTGSLPGANIALFSAMKSLGLDPTVTTSVGSSWWGANNPDFTWLDMEQVLKSAGVFPYKSVAASIGGADDQGGIRLSEVGRKMIVDATERNQVTLIRQGSLDKNVKARVELYQRVAPLNQFKAVINVGAGTAAVGKHPNGTGIPTGVNKRIDPPGSGEKGVLHYFGEANVPVVQVYDVRGLANKYNLPIAKLPLPKVGVGTVYQHKRYNLVVAGIAATLMLITLVVVKLLDRQQYKWREEGVDPDTLV